MEKTRVVLADDHAVVRAGIKKAIKGLNQVEIIGEAVDGPTLQHTLDTLIPDLLLIDVTMPDFDPIPSIKRIRRMYPDMKILVVSAYDDDVYVQGMLQAGVNGYHLKDQPLNDLRLAIKRVLSGERWISSPLVDKLISFREPNMISSPLSSRHREILSLLKKGFSNQEIALELNLSVKTIENHLTRIYRIIDVKNRVEAVAQLANNPHLLTSYGALPGNQIPESSSEHGKLALLLVDDNAQFRSQLNRMIQMINPKAAIYEPDASHEALEIAERVLPDLILVDVLLGEENGIQCAKQLKKVSNKSRIVLISAYPDSEFHKQSIQAGAAAFIDKKLLDLATLSQIVEDLSPGSDVQHV